MAQLTFADQATIFIFMWKDTYNLTCPGAVVKPSFWCLMGALLLPMVVSNPLDKAGEAECHTTGISVAPRKQPLGISGHILLVKVRDGGLQSSQWRSQNGHYDLGAAHDFGRVPT